MKRALVITITALSLAGCTGDIFDDIEDQRWDELATKVSDYCTRADRDNLWVQRTRIESRREIRQRGRGGPVGPDVPPEGLDEKTAYGAGPVLMVWCHGETNGQGEAYPVPDPVWDGMVRDWQD
jgi:hypothetical protein